MMCTDSNDHMQMDLDPLSVSHSGSVSAIRIRLNPMASVTPEVSTDRSYKFGNKFGNKYRLDLDNNHPDPEPQSHPDAHSDPHPSLPMKHVSVNMAKIALDEASCDQTVITTSTRTATSMSTSFDNKDQNPNSLDLNLGPGLSENLSEGMDDINMGLPNDDSSRRLRGCMTVRTQEDSVDPQKYYDCTQRARKRRMERQRTRIYSRSSSYSRFPSGLGTNTNTISNNNMAISQVPEEAQVMSTSSSSSSTSKNQTNTLRVKFDTIEIRSFAIVLGDNPSVTKGPPISIGWNYFAQCELPLVKFERSRPPRRWKPQLKIPWDVRYDLLERCGERDEDVEAQVRAVERIKHQRMQTEQDLWKTPYEDGMERMTRCFKKLFSSTTRKKKMEERQYLQMCRGFDEEYAKRRLAEEVLKEQLQTSIPLSICQ